MLAPAAAWLLLAAFWIWRMDRANSRWHHYLYPVLPLLVVVVHSLLPEAGRQIAAGYLANGLTLWALLTAVWLLSLIKRDASIMDIVYPLAPLVAIVVQWRIAGGELAPRTLLVLGLTALWALRLSIYIAWRYLPHGEEVRYAKWRARHGAGWWWWSYFQIFLAQAVIVWIWTLPLYFATAADTPLGPVDALAALIWLAGFVFEAGGDWQMVRFKRNAANKGKVMDRGLWALTRHPNYFGEALTWLSFFVLALAHPWGWLSLPCPLYVIWFMSRGSAASMTERYMAKSKPGYADYMAKTPAFFPRLWKRA